MTLNQRGIRDIIVVDDLKNGYKVRNLADADILDYVDKDDFLAKISSGVGFGSVTAVFHQGACSATTEWDGQYVMRNNYEYSKKLLHWSQKQKSPFIYASSASVYGLGQNGFREHRDCESPINMYAYSKFQFDQYVRGLSDKLEHQVVGLRYFNVYGPREFHKGDMSSTAYKFNAQIGELGVATLFTGSGGYGNGEQRRDFVFVDDCVEVNLWFLEHPNKSGVFNLGTGRAQSFNDVANAVIDWHGRGKLEYIPFPDSLKGAYQSFTQADLTALRAAGYLQDFHSVEQGVKKYLDWLNPV